MSGSGKQRNFADPRGIVLESGSNFGAAINWNVSARDPPGAVQNKKCDHIRHFGQLTFTNSVRRSRIGDER
jgi:hypothetical protein